MFGNTNNQYNENETFSDINIGKISTHPNLSDALRREIISKEKASFSSVKTYYYPLKLFFKSEYSCLVSNLDSQILNTLKGMDYKLIGLKLENGERGILRKKPSSKKRGGVR